MPCFPPWLRSHRMEVQSQKYLRAAPSSFRLPSGSLIHPFGHRTADGSCCHLSRPSSASLSCFPSGGAAPNLPRSQKTQALTVATPLPSLRAVLWCLIVLIVSQSPHSSSAIIQVFVPHRGWERVKQCEDNDKSDSEGQMTPSP